MEILNAILNLLFSFANVLVTLSIGIWVVYEIGKLIIYASKKVFKFFKFFEYLNGGKDKWSSWIGTVMFCMLIASYILSNIHITINYLPQ